MALRPFIAATALLTTVSSVALAEDFKNCGALGEGNYQVIDLGGQLTPETLSDLSLSDSYGLAHMSCDDGTVYYVSGEGHARQTVNHDNGPDYFAEGLARFIDAQTGLIGYMNPELETVIEAQYESALPFKDGGARVVLDGEATASIINQSGEVVESGILNKPASKEGVERSRLQQWGVSKP